MSHSKNVFIHTNAIVEPNVQIGDGTKIWANAHIRSGAVIGEKCIIGNGVFVDSKVFIGDKCKLQNYACIYGPTLIQNGVFVGPHVVICNDHCPKAITDHGDLKAEDDWISNGAVIEVGASLGASSVVMSGIKVGCNAMVGAGAVVTKDVKCNTTVVGVPAKLIREKEKPTYWGLN